MKRRFIIEQLDKRLLRSGSGFVIAFQPGITRGRTWSVSRPKINTSGKRRAVVRVIGATAALV
jgi:hypothetical protein